LALQPLAIRPQLRRYTDVSDSRWSGRLRLQSSAGRPCRISLLGNQSSEPPGNRSKRWQLRQSRAPTLQRSQRFPRQRIQHGPWVHPGDARIRHWNYLYLAFSPLIRKINTPPNEVKRATVFLSLSQLTVRDNCSLLRTRKRCGAISAKQ